jgi:hypothetical protein
MAVEVKINGNFSPTAESNGLQTDSIGGNDGLLIIDLYNELRASTWLQSRRYFINQERLRGWLISVLHVQVLANDFAAFTSTFNDSKVDISTLQTNLKDLVIIIYC